MSTPHGAAWMRHTEAYLKDRDLIKVFRLAMKRAGFPEVSAAAALEAICADFLAGVLRPMHRPGCAGGENCVCQLPRPFTILTDEKIAEQAAEPFGPSFIDTERERGTD